MRVQSCGEAVSDFAGTAKSGLCRGNGVTAKNRNARRVGGHSLFTSSRAIALDWRGNLFSR